MASGLLVLSGRILVFTDEHVDSGVLEEGRRAEVGPQMFDPSGNTRRPLLSNLRIHQPPILMRRQHQGFYLLSPRSC
jgi:hypothetical protein